MTTYSNISSSTATMTEALPGQGIMADNETIYADSEAYYADGSVVMLDITATSVTFTDIEY